MRRKMCLEDEMVDFNDELTDDEAFCGYAVEDLYQSFKARLLAEIVPEKEIMGNTVTRRLVDIAPQEHNGE